MMMRKKMNGIFREMKVSFGEFFFDGELIDGETIRINAIGMSDLKVNYFIKWFEDCGNGFLNSDTYKRDGFYEGVFYYGKIKGCFPKKLEPDSVTIICDVLEKKLNFK